MQIDPKACNPRSMNKVRKLFVEFSTNKAKEKHICYLFYFQYTVWFFSLYMLENFSHFVCSLLCIRWPHSGAGA